MKLGLLTKKAQTWMRVLREEGPAAGWSLFVSRVQRVSRTRPGGLVRLGPCVFRSDAQSRELLLEGVYEKNERWACERYVRSDIPVVEFGGSLGVVACLLNRRLKAPDRHVVIEANPENLPLLTENRNRNGCKFEILHAAAGVPGKTARLYFGNGAITGSSLAVAEHAVEISAVTLGEVIRERAFERCALVCDIEGSEIYLLHSEIDVFRSKIEVFIVEFHPRITGPEPVADARLLLNSNGFEQIWEQGDVFAFRNKT